VKDANGQLIADLEAEEFELTDNGVPQAIAVFEKRTEQPLSVSLLIDTSLTTAIRLKEERRSVERFLQALFASGNEQDQAALYAFNDEVVLLQEFSRDLPRFRRSLARLQASGGTSLYDALFLAADSISRRPGRHVVVVVTDGNDTTSRLKINRTIQRLQETDTVAYPIVVVPVEAHAGRSIGGENALQIIAQRTGGKVYAAALGMELDAVFSELLRDLRTQYLLGFYPRGAPPSKDGYHVLRLRTKRPGLLVQTRSGYYGEAGSPQP
jgi:Ca-activated chloride channel family protein